MKFWKKILPVFFVPALVYGVDATFFNFESGLLPDNCALDSGRTAEEKGENAYAETEEGKTNGSVVCVTQDVNRGGVFVRSRRPDDALGGELSAFTVCFAFRASPLSATPVFLERLVGGTSDNTGFFRFRSQSNSGGGGGEQRGTFRFYTKDASGNSVSVTSSVPWIQQENNWYWVGMVFDKGRVAFYLDGERVGDELFLPVESIAGSDGRSYFLRSGYGFVGAFDDLAIVPGRAFSDEEMRAIYKQGINTPEMIQKLKGE